MKTYNDIPEIKDRIYLENELVYACLTNLPITPGHTLIIPKRAVATFGELTSDELLAVHNLTNQVTEKLQLKVGAQGFNFAWNQGADYGQSIDHFHLQIIPRTPGDDGIYQYEPREFLYRPGTMPTSPERELADFARSLK